MTAKSKEKLTLRRRALILRADCHRIAELRRNSGEVLPVDTWADVLAATLALAPRGPTRIGGRLCFVTFPGLDHEALRRDLRDIGIEASDSTIAQFVDQAVKRRRPISPTEIGRRLRLTREERAEAGAWNILAAGQTREELKAERELKKKESWRQTCRAKGVQERGEWLAGHCQEAAAPWKAEGISRATYYRRKKAEAKAMNGEGQSAVSGPTAPVERPVKAKLRQVRGQPITIGNKVGDTTDQSHCDPSTLHDHRPAIAPRGGECTPATDEPATVARSSGSDAYSHECDLRLDETQAHARMARQPDVWRRPAAARSDDVQGHARVRRADHAGEMRPGARNSPRDGGEDEERAGVADCDDRLPREEVKAHAFDGGVGECVSLSRYPRRAASSFATTLNTLASSPLPFGAEPTPHCIHAPDRFAREPESQGGRLTAMGIAPPTEFPDVFGKNGGA
jgi:hypothetical protein